MLTVHEIKRLEHYGFPQLLAASEPLLVDRKGVSHVLVGCPRLDKKSTELEIETLGHPDRTRNRCRYCMTTQNRSAQERHAHSLADGLPIYPDAPPTPNTFFNALRTADRVAHLRALIRPLGYEWRCQEFQQDTEDARQKLIAEEAAHLEALSQATAVIVAGTAARVAVQRVTEEYGDHWKLFREISPAQAWKALDDWRRRAEHGKPRAASWHKLTAGATFEVADELLGLLETNYAVFSDPTPKVIAVLLTKSDECCIDTLLAAAFGCRAPHRTTIDLVALPAAPAEWLRTVNEGYVTMVKLPSLPGAVDTITALWHPDEPNFNVLNRLVPLVETILQSPPSPETESNNALG